MKILIANLSPRVPALLSFFYSTALFGTPEIPFSGRQLHSI